MFFITALTILLSTKIFRLDDNLACWRNLVQRIGIGSIDKLEGTLAKPMPSEANKNSLFPRAQISGLKLIPERYKPLAGSVIRANREWKRARLKSGNDEPFIRKICDADR